MNLNIVLVEPEIPQNTGNIARTCAATGCKLHLVHPLGFNISDRYVKRAGLDYWNKLEIEEHTSLQNFLDKYDTNDNSLFFVTTKGQNCYSDVNYNDYNNIFFLFGKETKGLPENLLKKNLPKTIRIPMKEALRSLNLSNSASIVSYEALRQSKFENLKVTSEILSISDIIELAKED